jgi:hypothetical protein
VIGLLWHLKWRWHCRRALRHLDALEREVALEDVDDDRWLLIEGLINQLRHRLDLRDDHVSEAFAELVRELEDA